MTTDKDSPYLEDDELSLRDLILRLREFAREVWRHWKIVAAVVVVVTGIFLVRAWLEEAVYPARLTFMVNEEEGNSLGGVASILGQFGLSAGDGGSYNRDRIVELARSRRIAQAALLDSATLHGQSDLLANHLIRIYDYPGERWRKDTLLREFTFTGPNVDPGDRLGQRALQSVYGHLTGDPRRGTPPLYSVGYNDDTGILFISAKTVDEELSITLTEKLYRHLSNFYIRQSTQRQQQTYDNLQTKVDSVQRELQSAESRLARLQDASYGLTRQSDQLQRERLDRQVRMLNVLYAEVVRNKETAAFLLKNATPVFQVIDVPVGPIFRERSSLIKMAAIGVAIGLFFSVAFIVTRKIIRESTREA